MTRILSVLTLAILAGSPHQAFAQAENDPLAPIYEQLRLLTEKVDTLEQRLARIEATPTSITRADQSMDEKGKTRWINQLRTDLRKADAIAKGPWTEAPNWQKISLKMKEDEALEILGEPTRSKFSIRKDTDMIHIYEGDLDGTGKLYQGEVRIYKGKVSDILVPNF